MNSKKKLIISGISLVAVVLVAIISITLVLALPSVTTTSSFTISYTASKDVKASIDVKYVKTNANPATELESLSFGNIGLRTIDPGNTNGDIELTDAIDLESTEEYVVIQIAVTNNDTANAITLNISGKPLSSPAWIARGYLVADTPSLFTPEDISNDSVTSNIEIAKATSATKGTTKYVYIKYTVNGSGTGEFEEEIQIDLATKTTTT